MLIANAIHTWALWHGLSAPFAKTAPKTICIDANDAVKPPRKGKEMTKLVAYFSATGTTEEKAQQLAELVGADLNKIEAALPYTRLDLDWMNRDSRATMEMRDWSEKPDIADHEADFSGYDVVYLGFPIWWYTAPALIHTFLDTYDLSGKQIKVFATSGGSRIDRAIKDLTKLFPDLTIVEGKLLNKDLAELFGEEA